MNTLINEKIKITPKMSLFSILLVFIPIFFNNESFPTILFNGPGQTIMYLFAAIGSAFFVSIILNKKGINKRSIIIVIILITSLFSSMLLNQDYSGGFIQVVLGILIGYMFPHLISLNQFGRSYVKIILVLAIYSLVVTYLLRTFTFNLPTSLAPIRINSEGVPFIDLRFSVVLNEINYFRNFGIFREPGVYQLFLNLALIFELFFKKSKANIVTVLILCISVVSTFSTPGYISTVVILIIFLIVTPRSLISYKNEKKVVLFSLITFIILGIIFFQTNDIFAQMLVESFEKLTQKESSYQGRMIAVLVNLQLWIENPVFGGGINALSDSVDSLMQNTHSFSTSHNTSTIGAMLVSFGSIFVIILMIGLYSLVRKSGLPIIAVLVIFVVIMILINTQLLLYNEVLYIIIAYGLYNSKG